MGFRFCKHILICALVLSSCNWSVTRLPSESPSNIKRLDSIAAVVEAPPGTAVICSRLPIKIIGIDRHGTSSAYRYHHKAVFLVDPGRHRVAIHFGDEWRFPLEPLEGLLTVEPESVTEIELDNVIPDIADVAKTARDTLWSVRLVTDERACR